MGIPPAGAGHSIQEDLTRVERLELDRGGGPPGDADPSEWPRQPLCASQLSKTWSPSRIWHSI